MSDPARFDLDPKLAAKLKFNDAGLIPVIVQAEGTKEVLMMAWMDDHALAHSLATRKGTYFSRSRNEYWIKGMTSGHVQEVVSIAADCDGDTLLMVVRQTGAACHTGTRTCFDDRKLPCAQ
ncbi:phosphoribosyl-AMP cyclohydrolase [Corynebacterium hindlerae]|uniref:Phosphoribosyl-AMP cyclohydrolase n=1 Tax=Corynebacterium hindlerae TaxID=699041 RepID=A0A7G5FG66_9CORY|nr:phosphoribosyl-AMP cyclohydrolase [Corynebacterium hindlerae]QMV85607.1 phosphoribosyl-AMP cyclohydrolase [Corynebacterium hindlerae]